MVVTFTFPKISFAIVVVVSFYHLTNAQYLDQICNDRLGTYSRQSDYGTNLNKAITQLASSASTSYFSTVTVGKGSDKVNALYSCRYDVSSSLCQHCVEYSLNNISSCPQKLEGLIIYQDCTVHYTNGTIFGVMEYMPQYSVNSLRTIEDNGKFVQLLSKTSSASISDAITEFATSSRRYFSTMTGKYSDGVTLYTLAQCNEDVTPGECRTCLQTCIGNLTESFPGAILGQMFTPSCRLSYRLSNRHMSPPYDFTIEIVKNTTDTPSADSPSSSSDLNTPPRVPTLVKSFSPTGTKEMPTVGAVANSITGLIISLSIFM